MAFGYEPKGPLLLSTSLECTSGLRLLARYDRCIGDGESEVSHYQRMLVKVIAWALLRHKAPAQNELRKSPCARGGGM